MAWLLPSLGYTAAAGMLAITTKLALRSVPWTELVLWGGIGYAILGFGLIAVGGQSFQFGPGTGWAAASGFLAAATLVVFYVALNRGETSRVVPVTAAYPVASTILAAIFLAEKISVQRAVGTVIVVIGVIILSRETDDTDTETTGA